MSVLPVPQIGPPGCIVGVWEGETTEDPITKLVSFPAMLSGLECSLPKVFELHGGFGLAIGDVDNLKSYVESVRRHEPLLFGHLAGNEFMQRLGVCLLEESSNWKFPWQVLGTFGGDEVIIAVAGTNPEIFAQTIRNLAMRLRTELPRSLSFAHAWFHGTEAPFQRQRVRESLVLVDRTLFRAKSNRSSNGALKNPAILALPSYRLGPSCWIEMR